MVHIEAFYYSGSPHDTDVYVRKTLIDGSDLNGPNKVSVQYS